MVANLLKKIFPSQNNKRYDPRVAAIIEKVGDAESVLDIGCVQHDADKSSDDFWLHSNLCMVADDVVGLDYLEEEVDDLNERGYDVVCQNAEDFNLDREFEVVVAGELIEHLSNPGMFLDSVHEHLSDEGEFILSTPNAFCMYRILSSVVGEVPVNPEHTCYFDRQTIRQTLNRHDFEVKHFEYVPSPCYDPIHSHMNILYFLHKSFYELGQRRLGGLSMVLVAEKQN